MEPATLLAAVGLCTQTAVSSANRAKMSENTVSRKEKRRQI